MNHPRHHHTLVLLETPSRPYKCKDCKELGFGPCYHCKTCMFHVHLECVTAMCSRPFVAHPFDPCCTLEHRDESSFNRACDACGRTISGARYRHRLGVLQSLDYHPCCLMLRRTVASQGVELNLVNGVSSKCLKCKRRSVSFWSGRNVWSYATPCGRFCYHVAYVKDLIMESFDRGSFDRSGYVAGGAVPAASGASFSTGAGQNQIARRSSAGRFVTTIMIKMVFKLAVSAIFGDPTTLVSDFILGAISSSHS